MQSIYSIGTYGYEMNKDLVFKKDKSKCNNIMKQCKNF